VFSVILPDGHSRCVTILTRKEISRLVGVRARWRADHALVGRDHRKSTMAHRASPPDERNGFKGPTTKAIESTPANYEKVK